MSAASYLLGSGIELISLSGNILLTPYTETKALCFTTDGSIQDLFGDRSLFERRPKVPGLWVRFQFKDGDRLEGILPHNLLEWPDPGYSFTPPRAGATRQRVFVPRAALAGTELRGVIGIAGFGLAKDKKRRDKDEQQIKMFEP